jgi:hypothetical protein
MGPVSPNDVEEVLKWAHIKILPSKSENYGHSMVEALSAGKPMISSHFIPWNDLNINNAGFNVDPNNLEELVDAMEFYANVDATYYDILSSNASVYIRNKVKEDSLVYAETLFLQKMTRKNFLSQLRQVDNGDNSARMHEVINQTIREVRENSKFASTMRSDLEKFYKDVRGDLIEVADKMKQNNPQSQSDDSVDDGQVVDSKKLNDMINEALLKKKS